MCIGRALALALTWAGCDGDGKSPVDDLHPTGTDTGTTAPDSGDTGTGAPCVDADGDGWCAGADDCADDDPAVNPTAADAAGDGVDTNCDGRDGAWALWLGDQPQWAPTLPTSDAGRPLLAGPDVDGDGLPDVIVGAPAYLTYPYDDEAARGTVTVLRGDGAVLGIHHGPPKSFASAALAPGGDLDGDGQPDLAVWHAGDDMGGVWILPVSSLSGTGDLATLATATVTGPQTGILELHALMGVLPDVTGDGADDLVALIGQGGPEPVEEVRLYSGPLPSSTAADAADVVLTGVPRQVPGCSFGGTDLGGDGVTDLIVGACEANGGSGRVYVVPGPVSTGALADAPVQWDGLQPDGELGFELAVGDVDGDAVVDVVIGAPLDDRGGDRGGRAFLVPGDAPTGAVDDRATATFEADRGHRFVGYTSALGDVDGDGQVDVAIGAPDDGYFPEGPGEVWIYRGPVAGTQTRDDAWHVLRGAQHGDVAGAALATTDWDADGRADLAIGAPGDDAAGWNAGRVYLVPGAALE